MATLGDGPYRTADAARAAGYQNMGGTSASRDDLIAKELLWSPRRGQIDFTVPRFARYLRGTHAALEWGLYWLRVGLAAVRDRHRTHEGVILDSCVVYAGHMTDLALLARELGVHERTLRRAVAQGSLRASGPTARSVQISLSERQYARRSWKLLSTLRGTLRTEHNVRFALLFGSAARGTDAPASDLDVLVALRDPSLERVVELGARLTAATGRRVDVVRLEDARSESAFFADVIADGRVLVDRAGLWSRLRAREASLRRESRRHDAQRTRAALAGIDRVLAP